MKRPIIVLLLFALASCTSSAPRATQTTPPPTAVSATPTISPRTPVASVSKPPTASRTPFGGGFTRGSAHVKITGGHPAARDLPTDPENASYQPPPKPSGIEWRNPRNDDQTTIFGRLENGKTNVNYTFTIAFTSIGFYARSDKGECTLAYTQANADGVKGSASCKNWKLPDGKVITVDATFSAIP